MSLWEYLSWNERKVDQPPREKIDDSNVEMGHVGENDVGNQDLDLVVESGESDGHVDAINTTITSSSSIALANNSTPTNKNAACCPTPVNDDPPNHPPTTILPLDDDNMIDASPSDDESEINNKGNVKE